MKFLLLLTFTLASIALALASSGNDSKPDAALRQQGKNIFVERCAKCHDADAAKKLPDGTTLLQRLAASKDLEARIGTRLKQPQERHAVTVYIESLLKAPQQPKDQ